MATDQIIRSESEYKRLLKEVHELQARIAELTALRDDLVYHVCPALRAEYEEKIASLERELLAANMYLREKQRIIEILQAQMNRRQKPSYEKAETEAKEEFREYEEDLKRKAEEARRRKEQWEKENQWSAHDKAEKDAGNSETSAGNGGNGQEDASGEGGNANGSGQAPGQGNPKNPGDGAEGQEGSSGKTDSSERESSSGNAENSGQEGSSGKAEDSDQESASGKKAGSGQENQGENGEPERETPGQRLKRLYRKIVKRLHPDMHPNPTEHEKDLFNRATAAYEKGNLQEMERIWEELSGMDAPEDTFEDTAEGRKRLRELLEKLSARMRLLVNEIDQIRSEFPYTVKSFLEDEDAVAQRRRDLQQKIDHVREMDRKLWEFIKELREKLRKGETAG